MRCPNSMWNAVGKDTLRRIEWLLMLARRVACLVAVVLTGVLVEGAEVPLPLFIVGDEELRAAHLPGSGTLSDPFLIADVCANLYGTDYGIWLQNTSLHVLVVGAEISGVAGPTSAGAVVLENCQNVVVRGCVLYGNRVAVNLIHCSGVRIEGNTLRDNGYGLVLDALSRDNVVVGNVLANERNAVAFAPNQWSEDDDGNCWSDLGALSYRVAADNIDLHPRAPLDCPRLQDGTPPVLEVALPDPIVIEGGSTLQALGSLVRAWDAHDGSVAVRWNPGVATAFDAIGETSVTWSACDQAGNCVQATRTIVVVDHTAPALRVLGADPLQVEAGADLAALDPGAVAVDDCDGEVSVLADYAGVAGSRPGQYQITYTSCDRSANCASTIRSVLVVDRTAPVVTLLGDDPLRVPSGASLEAVDPGAKALDTVDGDVSARLVVKRSTVGVLGPGVYWIDYLASDASGNISAAVRRLVVVEMGDAPTLPSDPRVHVEVVDWTVQGNAVWFVASMECQEPCSARLAELWAASTALSVASGLPSALAMPLHYEITDPLGVLFTGEVPPSAGIDTGGLTTALFEVARTMRRGSESASEVSGFAIRPTELGDVRERVAAVCSYLAYAPRSYIVRATQAMDNGEAVFDVMVSIYIPVPLGEESVVARQTLENLTGRAATLGHAVDRALLGYGRVSVSVFTDVVGLVYQGKTTDADVTGWVDTYVHPLLGQF